jgi:diguanylate cyclase (GGDEF)-like protein
MRARLAVNIPASIEALTQRLANRSDSEHGQAIVRLVLVSIVAVYFSTDYFAAVVSETARLQHARWLVALSLSSSAAIFAHIVFRPAASVIRRLIGMLHDVAAISASIYLGESAGAAVAVIYLWITVGNGFRYGVAYLYGCAAMCISGFLLVYSSSEYWRDHGTLSLNILLTMLVVPPYVGSLLRSLHAAKAKLQHRATFDSLTGLLSRREIESAASALFQSDHLGHVLLFCDLDRFKGVNDVAGHAAGDKLLEDIADIIRNSVRKGDLCGRIGGDEFCVLLHGCSLEKGREIAEEIRSRVTGYRLAWGTKYFSVGLSIGIAPTDAVNDSDSLFRLADAACYAAKNAGRNRVHVVDPRTDLLDTQTIRRLGDDGAANDPPRGVRASLQK